MENSLRLKKRSPLGVGLEIADGLGRLERFLRETTETRGWDFEPDPGPNRGAFLLGGPFGTPARRLARPAVSGT